MGRVVAWTLSFIMATQNPFFGGGFNVYKLNKIEVTMRSRTGDANNSAEETRVVEDEARAFHSSYFEVLGDFLRRQTGGAG